MRITWLILAHRLFVYPLLFLAIRGFAALNPKLKRYFKVRKGRYWRKVTAPKNAIWIHCSSGELEYAKPLIRRLKKKGEKIVVTYFSPSVEQALNNMPEIDLVLPCPFDTRRSMQDFTTWLQPKVLFIARTDVWPEMLFQTKKQKIKAYLFSATLSDENAKIKNHLTRIIFQHLFAWLDHIYCVAVADADNFKQKLNIQQVTISGDARYMQCLYRLHSLAPLELQKAKSPSIVFGSTWLEDEMVIFPVLHRLQDLGFNCVLVPHETYPKKMLLLLQRLKEIGQEAHLLSQSTDPLNESLLIVDKVGILANLYTEADIAFVGGSFKSSVHSVMEPLAAGCNVIVGPEHHNSREALEFKHIEENGIHLVHVIENSEDLYKIVKKCLETDMSTVRTRIEQEVEIKNIAAKKGLELLVQATI